jgi:hypothetical protein
MRRFHIAITCKGITNRQMDRIVDAMQRPARLLHADAVLILGDDPAPKVEMWGQDEEDYT